MEPISLAGFIIQITQFGVEFFSRFLALSRSANGSIREVSDREMQIQAILVDIAALKALPLLTQGEDEHITACQKVLKQMSKIITSTKGNGKRNVISNARAAARAMRVSKRFEQLDHQLSVSMQALQLNSCVFYRTNLKTEVSQAQTWYEILT
ncbi:uncharacterized protein N7496_005629 [Penicillium cataractarum]|uniref:Uncharacterized protein n=1 Tax=Penicillium cataractarum TaxID=2100454 RepID=A0A9W9VG34_9EURO|nr:uncharacterized protein N7496_005629 [Penicillium cataractarum]KAJ5378220.1 hypothetical protein N7496_005629 [Penicillium cataractarum]